MWKVLAHRSAGRLAISKLPLDIDEVIARIEEAIEPYPKAALFELAEEGFNTAFEQLVACIISIRTLDEVMLPTAKKLFAIARTPKAVRNLTPQAIDELIHDCSFHENKAETIHMIATATVEEFGGKLPCDAEMLMAFKGVGPKCAHLTLAIACGEPHISVDVHVHRVTNRWGYVQTTSPEKTMAALYEKLPRRYWTDINRLLVPFGKHICTGRRPRCSDCPVLLMCQQVGVENPR